MPVIKFTRRTFFLGLIFLLFCGFILLALLIPILQDLSEPPLRIGDVAPYDIHAPSDLTYPSQILTARQQDTAAGDIPLVYSRADTSIARQQLEQLRNTLAYIDSVRADSFATQEQKISDLAALEFAQLSRDTIIDILSLSSSRWLGVSQEATTVLDQVMREPIRENQLIAIYQRIPSLISLSFAEDQSAIITALVQAFVVPNSLYDGQATEAARQQARSSVLPITHSFMTNEIIIQGGKVITPTDYEALQQFGLSQPNNRWQDIVSALGLTLITATIFIMYYRRNQELFSGSLGIRKLTLLITLFLLFLVIARYLDPRTCSNPLCIPGDGVCIDHLNVVFG